MGIAAIFLFAACVVGLEAWFTRGSGSYHWRDTENNIGLAAGWIAALLIFLPITSYSYSFAYLHQVMNIRWGVSAFVSFFLLYDFLIYIFHRLSHRYRWLWASHVVHHTASRLNALVALRQGWTDFFSGVWIIAVVLGFMGAPSEMIGAYFTIAMISQLWLHNEWAGDAGLIGLLFNTPSHHRVHHSLNSHQMNANYGQVLIIWDRLCGTFVAEADAPITTFGLEKMPPPSAGLLAIAFGESRAMFRDCISPISVRQDNIPLQTEAVELKAAQ